jgi:hypothetical protein
MARLYREWELSVKDVQAEQEKANGKLLEAQRERDRLLALIGSDGDVINLHTGAQTTALTTIPHAQLTLQARNRLRAERAGLQRTLEQYQDNTIVYYELTIENLVAASVGMCLNIGLVQQGQAPSTGLAAPSPLCLGLFPGSLAFTPHTGRIARDGHERALCDSHQLQQGDVFGCGWDVNSGEVFFTKNGLLLGVAFRNVPKCQHFVACSFFPAVREQRKAIVSGPAVPKNTTQSAGVRVAGSIEVSFNFGGSSGRRFRYRDLPLGGLLLPQGSPTMSYDPRCDYTHDSTTGTSTHTTTATAAICNYCHDCHHYYAGVSRCVSQSHRIALSTK